MTDFWQRLAARTLGETPRVEPAIAPLYALGELLNQPLEQVENIQDPDSLNSYPAPILASRLVELSPTSPFAELTRSPQPIENELISSQLAKNQPAENSSQPDKTAARIESEQRSIQPDQSAADRGLSPQQIDPVSPAQPIAPASIAPAPIALAQTSLSMRSSSLVPVSRSVNSIPPINPQISSPATLTSVQLPEDSTNQSSVASLPPIAIEPLIPTAPPQIAPPVDRPPPDSLQPIPPPQITPLIRRAEAIEAIAESNRRSLLPVALPTIQVTIGRIEIRATPPAANRPKPPRLAPQLSLQDYLKQQGGKP